MAHLRYLCCMTAILLSVLVLGACQTVVTDDGLLAIVTFTPVAGESGEEEPTATFTVTIPTETATIASSDGEEPTATPTATSTFTPTATPTADLSEREGEIPDEQTVENVINALAALPSPDGASNFRHVPPPERFTEEMNNIYGAMFENDILINQTCCDVFNREWATTFALPERGTIYQLVNIPTVNNEQPTLAEELPRLDASGRELAVGGLIVYQEATVLVDVDSDLDIIDYQELSLVPGVYVISLRQDGDDLFFSLITDGQQTFTEWAWEMRMRTDFDVDQDQLIFVTPDQICFSEMEVQVCLNLVSPNIETGQRSQVEIVEAAMEGLFDTGILSNRDLVNLEQAIASIEGPEFIGECQEILQGDGPEACLPSVVVAAASPDFQVTGISNQISSFLSPVGVMSVLRPISGQVFDETGELVELSADSYRVDFLETEDGAWLAQLVRSDGTLFYTSVQELPRTKGIRVDTSFEPVEEEPTNSQVYLGTIKWSVCQSLLQLLPACANGESWPRDRCLKWARIEWC